MGFESGGQGRTKILKFDIFPSIFARKRCLVSSGVNVILPLLTAPVKIFLAHP